MGFLRTPCITGKGAHKEPTFTSRDQRHRIQEGSGGRTRDVPKTSTFRSLTSVLFAKHVNFVADFVITFNQDITVDRHIERCI